jgi:hypothetical protein
MKPYRLVLPAVMILAQTTASADGGAVQLRQEAGDLLITVFSSPGALSVGPADISLLLQRRDGLDPVLDANVSLILRTDAPNSSLQAQATREQARNKLLYAAPVTFPNPGKWRIAVSVGRHGEETAAVGTLDVAPAPGGTVASWVWIVFPMAMSLFIMVREVLIRRRSRKS